MMAWYWWMLIALAIFYTGFFLGGILVGAKMAEKLIKWKVL